MKGKFDFSGWATKNDLKCADGRVIKRDAFKINDGMTVPLVWNHRHDTTSAVLGHALLENRNEGVYAYGFLNNTTAGKEAKEMIQHGDVVSLSIYANNLVQDGANVLHGAIREVSLVLAGANPGAFIESAFAHGEPIDEDDNEGVIFTGTNLSLYHSNTKRKKEDDDEDEEEDLDEDDEDLEDSEDEEDSEDDEDEEDDEIPKKKGGKAMALRHADDDDQKKGGKEPTIQEIVDTMNEDQKNAMYALIGAAVEDAEGGSDDSDDEEEEDDDMKHNVFDTDYQQGNFLSHDDMETIFKDAKRLGSLRDAVNENIESGVLAHSIDTTGMVGPSSSTASKTYGFRDPDMLFPDYKSLNNQPEWIKRDTDWVNVLMSGVHHTPFSRIKSAFADITEDDARARGYIKGTLKKEEVFTLLKRTTDPQTIYKKQKMDRDDIIDITDFDVVAWIKAEMRVMLDEEIARAILIGDGRSTSSDDKIQEAHVRPIKNDVPLFNTKVAVDVANGANGEAKAKAAIDAIIRARKDYKGTGNPTLFTTEDWLTEMLLIKDGMGHYLYGTETELATRLRVSKIVTVEVMENETVDITVSGSTTQKPLMGIIVNPVDYNVGADKGGSIELFDDFDIDYNQYKYLIETRISGALTKPFSALTMYINEAAAG